MEIGMDKLFDADTYGFDAIGQNEEINNIEEKNKGEILENETTIEINPDDLFGNEEDLSESVNNDEGKNKSKEDTTTYEGTSPNLYSSIANALNVDGVFTLTEEELKNIQSAEDFKVAIQKQVESMLEESQARVNKALNMGVEPTEILKYESAISYLNSIETKNIEEESEEGEKLRRAIIFQDFINRGFSEERATKAVENSFKLGEDIKDATEALASNKEFFKSSYDKLLKEAEENHRSNEKKMNERIKAIESYILNSNDVFGGVEVTKEMKLRAFDVITKAKFKDEATGTWLTELQKYQKDNEDAYMANLGLIYALTDGFKDINKLVKGEVRKQTKKGLEALEHTLRTSSGTKGNLVFANNKEVTSGGSPNVILDI